jgi:hypothetical protein
MEEESRAAQPTGRENPVKWGRRSAKTVNGEWSMVNRSFEVGDGSLGG